MSKTTKTNTDAFNVTEFEGMPREATDAELRAARKLAAKSVDIWDGQDMPIRVRAAPYEDSFDVTLMGCISLYHARKAVENEPFEVNRMLAYSHGGCCIGLQKTDE